MPQTNNESYNMTDIDINSICINTRCIDSSETIIAAQFKREQLEHSLFMLLTLEKQFLSNTIIEGPYKLFSII